jgi:DNA polymerase-4
MRGGWGEVLRVRTISRLGVDVRVGIGPSITVAATASGQITEPGGVLAIDPDQVADWLGPLPVEALHGIGPRQAQELRNFGVYCVGLLAAVPPATVQRLLGGRNGRLAADRARGIDPRPVTPRTLPTSASVSRTFTRHTLDGADVRATLLDMVVTLALQLRRRGQAARGLTLTLRFAGGTTWEKTRRLPEASAHDDDLRTLAYRLIDAAGLQRGRLAGITLKGEDLVAADQVAETASAPSSGPARSAPPPHSCASPDHVRPHPWRREPCCSNRQDFQACCPTRCRTGRTPPRWTRRWSTVVSRRASSGSTWAPARPSGCASG